MIDPEAFYSPRNPSATSANLPGKPSWGPYLLTEEAIRWERELIWTTPTAEAWDAAADARRRAWETSIFAASVAKLNREPHYTRPAHEEP